MEVLKGLLFAAILFVVGANGLGPREERTIQGRRGPLSRSEVRRLRKFLGDYDRRRGNSPWRRSQIDIWGDNINDSTGLRISANNEVLFSSDPLLTKNDKFDDGSFTTNFLDDSLSSFGFHPRKKRSAHSVPQKTKGSLLLSALRKLSRGDSDVVSQRSNSDSPVPVTLQSDLTGMGDEAVAPPSKNLVTDDRDDGAISPNSHRIPNVPTLSTVSEVPPGPTNGTASTKIDRK